MTVYVLGGGPAGLALVNGLAGREPFVLLERADALGGLARTLRWADHGSHDLGPHKLFTKDHELMRRVESLLPPSAWLTRPKRSSIFLRGRFLPYPPSPLALLGAFGPRVFAAMVGDYALARARSLRGGEPPATFSEDLEARVGRTLYRELFAPIATKLWGDPAELDVKLSRGRVQTPRLSELALRTLRIRSSSDFEALSFRYPKGGLGTLWASIEQSSRRHGEIVVGNEIERVVLDGRRVTSISCKDRATGTLRSFPVAPGDFVFSTLPVGALVRLLGDAIPADTREQVRATVRLNDLLLCFLKIDRPSLLDESWVFVPDPAIAFHRVSEQESFDPGMTPGGSIVCCEIMGHDLRETKSWSDAEHLAAVERGLSDMGYRGFTIIDRRVIRLPGSYPVYRAGYEPALAAILDVLDRFENLRSIGRQGTFNYIGTLDAMDIGFGAARWLAESSERRELSWRAERHRTELYPVLD